jgi:hypothetical protein
VFAAFRNFLISNPLVSEEVIAVEIFIFSRLFPKASTLSGFSHLSFL